MMGAHRYPTMEGELGATTTNQRRNFKVSTDNHFRLTGLWRPTGQLQCAHQPPGHQDSHYRKGLGAIGIGEKRPWLIR